jgi:hypothetical protein
MKSNIKENICYKVSLPPTLFNADDIIRKWKALQGTAAKMHKF